MPQPRSPLRVILLSRLDPPIPDDLFDAAELATDLSRAGHPDVLVSIPSGPSLPAGDLVELLVIDWHVDPRE